MDPRVSVKYFLSPQQNLSISTGLYTKPDHLSTYFIERRQISGAITRPNLDLKMLKAFHLVAAYDLRFKEDHRLKMEAYYQSLFDIPVGTNMNTVFSVLNTSTLFGIIFLNDMDGTRLVSAGKGKNYGVELTLEKFFSSGYYYLLLRRCSIRNLPPWIAENFQPDMLPIGWLMYWAVRNGVWECGRKMR